MKHIVVRTNLLGMLHQLFGPTLTLAIHCKQLSALPFPERVCGLVNNQPVIICC